MSFGNREVWVQRMFDSYGFTPDPGVVAALTSMVETDDQAGVASGTVGAYINAFNELQKAAANDPLQKLLVDEQAATSAAGASADQYATQLQDVYKQAPKLFGSMTPDQVDQYLAPLKSQFDYASGKVSGDAAARGNTGSSLEAVASAQTGEQFKQGVMSQGLQVGMTEQQNLAQMIQNLYNQKIAQQNLLYGLQQGTTGQLSQNKLQEAEFMAQLPILLGGQATQAAAMNQSKSGGWENIAGTVLGGAVGGIGGFFAGGPMGAAMGASAGAGLGGSIANDITGGTPTQTSAALTNLPLLYGMMNGNRTSSSSVPGGLNWASQPAYQSYMNAQNTGSMLPPTPLSYRAGGN